MAGHVVSGGHLKVAPDVRIGGNSVLLHDVTEPGDYMGYPLMEKRSWFRTQRAVEDLLDLQRQVRELRKRLDEQARRAPSGPRAPRPPRRDGHG
jgi:UDP-3-O-[3-hydroxymyristoyl] glucosamine N-acyltransferase